MNVKQMNDFIKNQNITVLTTLNEEGQPTSRAMTIIKNEDNKVFYFLTRITSLKYNQIKQNKEASLYFFDASTYTAVNLTGEAEILEDGHNKIGFAKKLNSLPVYADGDQIKDFCIIVFKAKKARLFISFNSYNFLIEE